MEFKNPVVYHCATTLHQECNFLFYNFSSEIFIPKMFPRDANATVNQANGNKISLKKSIHEILQFTFNIKWVIFIKRWNWPQIFSLQQLWMYVKKKKNIWFKKEIDPFL